jgi:hypothetical protein
VGVPRSAEGVKCYFEIENHLHHVLMPYLTELDEKKSDSKL